MVLLASVWLATAAAQGDGVELMGPFGVPPMGLAQLERVQGEPPPQRCVPASGELPQGPLADADVGSRGDLERLQRALAHYGADRLCLLPTRPPTPYLLTPAGAPRGVMMGESCTRLRREAWTLLPAEGGVWLVEDGQPLLAFAGQAQALRALGVFDWYGFGWRCQARTGDGRVLYLRR